MHCALKKTAVCNNIQMKIIPYILIIVFGLFTGCNVNSYTFDENLACQSLEKQAKWVHRYPGGEDAPICRQFLRESLEPYCDKYIEQDFTETVKGKELELKNIIGIINPKADKYIILASHYDNRPFSDKEKTIGLRQKPCPGANDGASSSALLLETAKVLKAKKPKVGVIIALFDGEDYGKDDDSMYIGSRYFAKHINDICEKKKVTFGILLDMIGDKDLNIFIEQISNKTAPKLVEKVWDCAKGLGYGDSFIPKVKYGIYDDHISLIEEGIDCIDIIDFDYKNWHTSHDTSDKCSPQSLKIVADVIIEFLYSDIE